MRSISYKEVYMDYLDQEILKILQKNCRTSLSSISRQIHLSIPACTERLKKLEANGTIKSYTAILSEKVLDRSLTSLMFISLERPRFTENFVKKIQQETEILECYYLSGNYDYQLKIKTKNTETLEKILNRIKNIEGVMKTETIVVLSTTKEVHSVSPVDDLKSTI